MISERPILLGECPQISRRGADFKGVSHAKGAEGAEAAAKERLDQAARFVTQHVAEVKNGIGGVIGYTLSLSMAETESLWKILESKS